MDIKDTKKEQIKELLNIPDIPKELYVRGEIPSRKEYKFVTFVGTRAYTPYGKRACEHIISRLSGYPIVIVSGLAFGIDSIAHKAAINAGLKTIGVLASGLDDNSIYPKSNISLAKDIVNGNGAIISETKEGANVQPYMFPQRNRIIAGISEITIVVECTEKSGTMITAKLANDYNKEVGVVMHDIFSPTNGAYKLLKEGAHPIKSASDILEILDFTENNVRNYNLTPKEELVMQQLSEPKTRLELSEKIKISQTDMNITISSLELKGLVTERLGKLHRN